METINYCQSELNYTAIPLELYNNLNKLGLIPNDVREANVGKSNYAKHTIQPWSIWIDYDLNPWDADIVKRILRTKEEEGMSLKESRLMDYEKIIHICKERIRQLNNGSSEDVSAESTAELSISTEDGIYTTSIDTSCLGGLTIPDPSRYRIAHNDPKPEIRYVLKGSEIEAYNDFINKHKECCNSVMTCFSHESGLGTSVKMFCPKCGELKDITNYDNW